jgi:hypothetical protein
MQANQYEVQIFPGVERKGYVEMRHGSQYSIRLDNFHFTRCDASVVIDGQHVGIWRLNAMNSTKGVTIERPANNSGRFTFYRSGSIEADQVQLGFVRPEMLGLVSVTFTPEAEVRRSGIKGVTKGMEDCAQFGAAEHIVLDESQAFTIHLRLVEAKQPAVRPLTQRQTPVPPPL